MLVGLKTIYSFFLKKIKNKIFTPLFHIPEDSDLCTDCHENLKISYES